MPQTQVTDGPGRPHAGQRSDLEPAAVYSAAAEGDVVTGQPVLRGTNPVDQCIAVADLDTIDDSTLYGIALYSPICMDAVLAGSTVEDAFVVDIMRQGVVYMHLTGTATAGQEVFVGNTTATLGDVQGTAGAGLVALPSARFVQSGSSGERCRVEVNLP